MRSLELEFEVGDIIAVFAVRTDGWWFGKMVNQSKSKVQKARCLFPSNFVEIIEYNPAL